MTCNYCCPPNRQPPRPMRSTTSARSWTGCMPPGFVTGTGRAHLADLARYLTAIRRRLERLPHGIEADRQRMHAGARGRGRLRRTGPRVAVCTPGQPPDVRDIALADRGAAGEPVGAAARYAAPGQRAADLPGDRRGRERPMNTGHNRCSFDDELPERLRRWFLTTEPSRWRRSVRQSSTPSRRDDRCTC